MSNSPIVEQFTLPSLGKVYNREINPNISLRSMNTTDEMRRLSHSNREFQKMSSIIDDCLIDKPGISAYDMIMGDYIFLLHKLRITTYGPEYPLKSICPYCGTINEETINLDDLFVVQYSDDIKKYMEFDLPVSQHHIKLRMQTPRMVDNINAKAEEAKSKWANAKEVDAAFLFTLCSVIDTIDGAVVDDTAKEQFVRDLVMRDSNTIAQYSEKLNNFIGIDSRLIYTCDNCHMDFNSTFRQTSEFFRPTLVI